MPIYMDRHDVSDEVTAETVAELHREDLKIQHKYGCRGLTYWFDETRKTAFCLIEAPNEKAVIQMHKHAHGEVPHQIIEVETAIVESFLGRIEDPEKAQDTNLNIINDPAFRTIMLVAIEHHSFKNLNPFSRISKIKQFSEHINVILEFVDGNIVRQNENGLLISFRKVTDAVLSAFKIQEYFKNFKSQYQLDYTELCIALNAGVPVTEKKSIFEDTIKPVQRMCLTSIAEVIITASVKQLYEAENIGESLRGEQLHSLSHREQKFLNSLMEFLEKEWQNAELKVEDIEKNIGISKSKLYREMMSLTGKSPNVFILDFRLRKSLQMLQEKNRNISEIAFASGFSSPSYFAKCFKKKYGIKPSCLALQ